MIEKKPTGPEQMHRFEERLRKLRDEASKRRDECKAVSDSIGYVMNEEQRHAYATALHELLLATGGEFGQDPNGVYR